MKITGTGGTLEIGERAAPDENFVHVSIVQESGVYHLAVTVDRRELLEAIGEGEVVREREELIGKLRGECARLEQRFEEIFAGNERLERLLAKRDEQIANLEAQLEQERRYSRELAEMARTVEKEADARADHLRVAVKALAQLVADLP